MNTLKQLYQQNHDELTHHCFPNYNFNNKYCAFEIENKQDKYE